MPRFFSPVSTECGNPPHVWYRTDAPWACADSQGSHTPMGPATVIKVLIVGNNRVARRHAHLLLEKLDDVSIVANAANYEQAVRATCQHAIDLAVLDISTRWQPALEMVRDLRTIRPGMKSIILAAPRAESLALRAIYAGADGCLGVETDPTELATTIRLLARGKRYICPDIAHHFALNLLRVVPGMHAS